jgi:hypothetical protein
MEHTLPNINKNYLFKWEPHKKTLFFITQGAHITGTAMKNLDEIQPNVVEKLKFEVITKKPTIGTVIVIETSATYVFIVSRKHYSSKHDLGLVKSALASLEGEYKMSNEDFPTITDLVAANFPNVEIKTTSRWEDSQVVDL